MTSTTFSNKKFPVLYKWAIKRNKPIIIVFSVLMALGIILDLYVMAELLRSGWDNHTESFGDTGLSSIIIAQGGAMFFTFLSALITFSFLHDKRSTDMFCSMPTTRTTLFVSHLFGGITAVALPFVIGSFVVMGITARTARYFLADLVEIGFGLLGIIAAYLLTALIAYCCGTQRDTAIITIGVNAIAAGTIGICWGLIAEMIPGVEAESIFMMPILTLLAPYAFCFFEDYFYIDNQTTALITLLVWSILFIVGIYFLAFRTAQKRKAEVAQSDFDIKWLPMVIKAGASIVCGGFVGFFAAMEGNSGYGNMIIFAFWYLVIGFAAFFILHIIFSKTHKSKFAHSLIVYICTSAVALIGAFSVTGGLGIDVYVPKASNLKSANFDFIEFKDPENLETITQIHKIIADGVRSANDYPYYLGGDYTDYVDYSTGTAGYPEDESLDYAIYDNSPMYEDYEVYDDYYYESEPYYRDSNWKKFQNKYPLINSCTFNFEYSKKVGFTTYRSYYLSAAEMEYYDYDAIEALLEKLYTSEEYKRSNNTLIWDKEMRNDFEIRSTPNIAYYEFAPNLTGETIYNANEYFGYTEVGTTTLTNDPAFINGLLDELKKDILADKEYGKAARTSDRYNDSFEGSRGTSYLLLSIDYKLKDEKVRNYYSIIPDYHTYYNGYSDYSIYTVIPESYTNTRKYLADHDIPLSYEEKVLYEDKIEPYYYLGGTTTDAYTYYSDFGTTGQYESLENCMKEISKQIEWTALLKAGEEDYIEWDAAHYTTFRALLLTKTAELYDLYKDDPDYIRSYYGRVDSSGIYFYMEDTIIHEADIYAGQIIKDINAQSGGAEKKPESSEKTESNQNSEGKTSSGQSTDANTKSAA